MAASAAPTEPIEPTPIAYLPPRITFDETRPAPRYYDWRDVFPFLQPVLDAREEIFAELKAATGMSKWFDWPETELYAKDEGATWRVLPFCHCIPATDASHLQWLPASASSCPATSSLLRRIPGLRTALFSRLGPSTTLTPHQGWADLSNHVLRCHLPLHVPSGGACGMVVEEEVKLHRVGEILMFDDSKVHYAFNSHSSESRYVLIFDIVRPPGLPKGLATGSTTDELQGFMAYFK